MNCNIILSACSSLMLSSSSRICRRSLSTGSPSFLCDVVIITPVGKICKTFGCFVHYVGRMPRSSWQR
nr:MAG TPA: hypothetical protein [Caudoviricetes sp.]